jgi:hypothetical protein
MTVLNLQNVATINIIFSHLQAITGEKTHTAPPIGPGETVKL